MLKWVSKNQRVVEDEDVFYIYDRIDCLSWRLEQLEVKLRELEDKLKDSEEMGKMVDDAVNGGIEGLKELLQYNQNVAMFGYDAVYNTKKE